MNNSINLSFCLSPQLLLGFAVSAFFVACNPKPKALFEYLPSSETGVHFSNVIAENDSLNVVDFYYLYNGGGVAIGDLNKDGLVDLVFTGNMVTSRLFLNQGNFRFVDATQEAGLETDAWATGVSMVDLDGDGWLDIYVSTGGPCQNNCPNLFFKNKGTNAEGIPVFEESGAAFGIADGSYTTHAAFLDYDIDGDLDMFLLRNRVDDVDKTMLLPQDHLWIKGKTVDRLYRNDGADSTGYPHFTDVSQEAGIVYDGYGLGVTVGDVNRDGWPDIYVANDFRPNDLLYVNQRDGTFKEDSKRLLKHQTRNGMGVDMADINNDGWPEIMVVDMLPEDNQRQKTMLPPQDYESFERSLDLGYSAQFMRNTLQLARMTGEEELVYSEIGNLAGISNTDWSWSPLFGDLDNDGYRDLYITNGFVRDMTDLDFIKYLDETQLFGPRKVRMDKVKEIYKTLKGAYLPNYVYRNQGGFTFEKRVEEWGLDRPSYSNGASLADLDNDGDLDIVVNNINQEAILIRNRSSETLPNNFLKVKLEGSSGNRQGLGAQVNIKSGGKSQFHYQSLYRGYLSTLDEVVHFGLGDQQTVDTLQVIWADGNYQLMSHVQANQTLTIDYRNATPPASEGRPSEPSRATLFSLKNDPFNIHYRHREDEYNDFLKQPLLLQKLSRNGPGIAVGNIDDKDGDDFFVGGAVGSRGNFFIQNRDGAFEGRPFVEEDPNFEDMGSLLFDADNDSDLDLYVVSGGSSYEAGSEWYQDRLYLNDGGGSFVYERDRLPMMRSSGSSVTAADFDRDGDLDLFVGGRVVPGNYPLAPESFLLENENGTFRDVTSEVGNGLNTIGMVTSAVWTDFNNDSWIDLVIVGEWMPITLFENKSGRFENITAESGLSESTTGWWNSILSGDFDNDGDSDYIVGNLGLNSRYKASPQEPVRVYAKDYDSNGSIDPIITCYINDNKGGRHEYPAHSRDALTGQLVKLKKKFLTYEDFSLATINDLLSPDELSGALVLSVQELRTSLLENLGDKGFRLSPLPVETQFSQVHGMVSLDYDGDGNLDLIIGGNSYATESMDGWYDASVGVLLKGRGTGDFTVIETEESGLLLDKDIRSIAKLLTRKDEVLMLASANNDSLSVWSSDMSNHRAAIRPGFLDSYAIIYRPDGSTTRVEFDYGSSYLSQSSRYLVSAGPTDSITIFDYNGISKTRLAGLSGL